MAERKTPSPGAKRGKVKGEGTVTQEEDGLVKRAREAGRRASEVGTPGKPPKHYTRAEVEAWFEGYKTHANPNSTGTVEGIDSGYRNNY